MDQLERFEDMCEEIGGTWVGSDDDAAFDKGVGVCEVGGGESIAVHDYEGEEQLFFHRDNDELTGSPRGARVEGDRIVVGGVGGYASGGPYGRTEIRNTTAYVDANGGITYEATNTY